MKKFKHAQAQNQASIERHLDKKILDSSSDEENEESVEVLQQVVNKTLLSYNGEGGDSEKVLSYLTDLFQFGGAVCLICISSVKKLDAIWSCTTCYSFMHLTCIQHWIRDSLSYKHEKGIKPLWACPKCRTDYPENSIPKDYKCFCSKTTDPPYQAWSIPHSCGEQCSKPLQPVCGHRCTLLCHPGPCPPCPKMVRISCYCQKSPANPRRCNAREWSCNKPCNKQLPNCSHNCQENCHADACLPCSESVLAPCHCGAEKSLKKCSESSWRCSKPCETRFPCKIHTCTGTCHRPGDCGECLYAKNRTCPCGKKKYNVACKQETIPTCGDTCGKMLDCGRHTCNMRCHPDHCGQCLEVVTKSCRCGSYTKELPCAKEYHCAKKCTQMRLCGRHPCNKKCCDCLQTNTFNSCEKVCDNTLNCRKHKCPAPCHSGPCYPCPKIVVIQCRCGGSKVTVPCGTKKRIKPPPCNRMCKIPPICHHLKRESHKCHQGECPPCKKVCDLVRKRCGHVCPAVCHTKVWVKVPVNGTSQQQPLGPWDNEPKEVLKQKTLPCPPCEVSVMVTCLGGHETLPWPCHNSNPTSCQRVCGQILPCSNHTCGLLCHRLKNDAGRRLCKDCERPCQLERPQGCSHACEKICHPAPCAPCRQIVRISCHCGLNTLYKRCVEMTSATSAQRDELLKCGNQCPKNYPCGHRCVDDCHPGPCRNSETCNKKVKVTCKCSRIKKSFFCLEVQQGNVTVTCDEQCAVLKKEKERLRELELEKKKREEEIKNQREVERFERKFKPRKKGKDRLECLDNAEKYRMPFWIKAILFGALCSITVAITFYITDKGF